MSGLKLIVGLGNPGPAYADTRHNVGAVWVRELARRYSISLGVDTKFKGEIGRGLIGGTDVRLLLPSTFMNNSGESVGAVSRFFKLEPQEILVAYDEVAFEPGVVKLKQGGGSNVAQRDTLERIAAYLEVDNPPIDRITEELFGPGRHTVPQRANRRLAGRTAATPPGTRS